MAPYSMDLPKRVAQAWDAGLEAQSVAAKYDVSRGVGASADPTAAGNGVARAAEADQVSEARVGGVTGRPAHLGGIEYTVASD